MEKWEPLHLHWNFRGEHVLLHFLILKSFPSFLLASLLLIVLCTTERIITSYHEATQPAFPSSLRWRVALRRCLLYWIAMILRLFYMLATMTFNMGLILATSLATTQFILDLRASHPPQYSSPEHTHDLHHFTESRTSDLPRTDSDRLFPQSSSTFVVTPTTKPPGRPRSKSKPEGIFIHPSESNIARADIIAMQLGLSGDTERVSSLPKCSPTGPDGTSQTQWKAGTGRDVAREMLLNPQKHPGSGTDTGGATSGVTATQHHYHHQRQRSDSFQIGPTSDSSNSDVESDEDDEGGYTRHGRHHETRKLVRS